MCGLDNVWLENGFTYNETPYGQTVQIDEPEELDHAIALLLLEKPYALNNKELRFLRQFIGLSQLDLGSLIGVDAQTVARWEKNEEITDSAATRLARFVFVSHLNGNESVCVAISHLKLMDRVINDKIIFTDNNGEWQARSAEPIPT